MAEWFKAAVLRTAIEICVGSNPTPGKAVKSMLFGILYTKKHGWGSGQTHGPQEPAAKAYIGSNPVPCKSIKRLKDLYHPMNRKPEMDSYGSSSKIFFKLCPCYF